MIYLFQIAVKFGEENYTKQKKFNFLLNVTQRLPDSYFCCLLSMLYYPPTFYGNHQDALNWKDRFLQNIK